MPAGIARAARIADGWMVVPVPTVDEFAAQAADFATARAAAGLPPSRHVCRLIEVACAPDEETAVRRAAPFLLAKYAAYLSWGIPGISLDAGAPPEAQLRRLAANRFAVGSPAQVVEALLAQHRAGRHARHHARELARDAAGGHPAGLELLGRRCSPRSAAEPPAPAERRARWPEPRAIAARPTVSASSSRGRAAIGDEVGEALGLELAPHAGGGVRQDHDDEPEPARGMPRL